MIFINNQEQNRRYHPSLGTGCWSDSKTQPRWVRRCFANNDEASLMLSLTDQNAHALTIVISGA